MPKASPSSARTGPLDEARVVATALEVLEVDGIDHLTMATVARRLDVTQPALYRHVGTFDEMLGRIAVVGRRRIADGLRDAAVGRSRDDAVRAVAAAWRAVALADPNLYMATDRVAVAGDEANERAAADIVTVLTRVTESYGLEAPESERAAWALRSALHGFADLEVRRGYPSTLEIDETFERLVSLLVAGLRGWEAVADDRH